MNGTRASSVMRRRRSPIIRACFSSSIAHGPPMRQSDDLDQLLVRPDARDPEAALHERVEIVVVDLEAMPVALLDRALPVDLRRGAPLFEDDRIEPEPHRAAL